MQQTLKVAHISQFSPNEGELTIEILISESDIDSGERLMDERKECLELSAAAKNISSDV